MKSLAIEYESLTEDFSDLDESDFLSAANITTRAANLKATYDRQLAALEKVMDDAHVEADALEKRKSIELNPNNVSDGERKAKCDHGVVEAKLLYNEAKFRYQDLFAVANHINNIYYTAKMFYENATRGMREGR